MTYCTDRLISIPRLLRPPHSSSSSSYPQVNCPSHSQLTEQAQVGWIMVEHEGAKESLRRTVIKSRVFERPLLLLLRCKPYYPLCGFIKQIIYYVILYRRYWSSSYLKVSSYGSKSKILPVLSNMEQLRPKLLNTNQFKRETVCCFKLIVTFTLFPLRAHIFCTPNTSHGGIQHCFLQSFKGQFSMEITLLNSKHDRLRLLLPLPSRWSSVTNLSRPNQHIVTASRTLSYPQFCPN